VRRTLRGVGALLIRGSTTARAEMGPGLFGAAAKRARCTASGTRVISCELTPLLAIRGLRAAYGKIEALKGVRS